MANVLTSLAGDIYRAADVVGRELVGIIPSSTINSGSERVALNDTVRSFFTRTPSVGTITPSMTIPEGTDQTVDNKTLTIDKTASVKIPWTGEDIRHVNNGSGFTTIYGDQIMQAMRSIVNQIEADMALAIKVAASRAHGTLGTTPFGSNFSEIAQLRKILVDNGCPMDGRVTLCMDTAAGANLRNLAQLQKVNEGGSNVLLRQGELLDLQGIKIKETAGIVTHTIGTGSGYNVNNVSGYAVGSTAITLEAGSGTIVAGDIFTNSQSGRDANKYVVGTALTSAVVTLNDPGIRKAWVNDDTVAVGAAYTPNVVFHQTAVELAVRPYAVPMMNGMAMDAAMDSMIVVDPWSGLVFEIKAYSGYNKAMFDVQCVYGIKAWKPPHIAILAG